MRKTAEHQELLEKRILEVVTDNKIVCEEAFAIAQDLDIPTEEVRMAADRLGIKISNCQLGCF